MNTVIKTLVIGGSICLGSAATIAAPVTFLFSGQMNPSPISSSISISPTLSGSYTFDDSTPDTFPPPEGAIYADAISNFTFSMGDYTGSTNNGTINVRDNGGSGGDIDSYTVILFGPEASLLPAIGDFTPLGLSFSLFQSISGPDALSSTALPLIPPNPADFSIASFDFLLFNASTSKYARLSGVIDTLTLAARDVPAPAASLLLIVGLAAVGLRRKKS